MKRWVGILLAIIVWGLIVAYFWWAVQLRQAGRKTLYIRTMTITIPDSAAIDILSPSMVEQWIGDAELLPIGRLLDNIHTDRIEAHIAGYPFVHSVRAYGDIRGDVHIVVTQREPMFRIISDRGDDLYYTTDGCIELVQTHSAHYVPVVTGTIPLPFALGWTGKITDIEKKQEQNLYLFTELVNFVDYITHSELWSAQIEQIVFEKGTGGAPYIVRLVPRVGSHTIVLGELDDYRGKLSRVGLYYERVAAKEGWTRGRELDARYRGEIVVR